jgi:23S rRNA (pseudouridine1915-N3)-methyltransferase
VGRDRSGWFEPGVKAYAGRIEHHARLELIELPAATGSLLPAAARRKEGAALLRRAGEDAWLVALDERGTALDSPAFARLIGQARDAGRDLTFVLGGDEGLDPEVRERAWKVVSLSAMTLPHRLARLVLMEQIYRAFTLLRGEPYHK